MTAVVRKAVWPFRALWEGARILLYGLALLPVLWREYREHGWRIKSKESSIRR